MCMVAPRAVARGVAVAKGEIVQASGSLFVVKACLKQFLAVGPLSAESGPSIRSWRCREVSRTELLDCAAHPPQQVSRWTSELRALLVLA